MSKADSAAVPPLGTCPRCRYRLDEIEGFQEYGDQLYSIVIIGCYRCGYQEGITPEEDEDTE